MAPGPLGDAAGGSSPPPSAAAGGSDLLLLEVVRGNALGAEIEVQGDFLIGRHVSGAGTLGADLEISRHHARISRAPDGHYVIEDLASTNGTFVNGTRIGGPQTLADGDRIELGDTTLVVRRGAASTTAAGAVADALAGEPAPEAPAALPPLALRIDVDFAAREARVALDDESDAVRLAFQDGRWRTAPE